MIFSQISTNISLPPAPFKLSELIGTVPVVQMYGPWDPEIGGITTDTRKMRRRWLFAAVEGEHVDGHMFVQKAIEQGASCVVAQYKQYEAGLKDLLTAAYCQHNATTVLVVHDSRVAVALLADRFYKSPSKKLKLIGITGTNGKTTTSYLLKSILETAGEKVGLIGTIEHHIGKDVYQAEFTTPPAEELHAILAEMVKKGCTAVVMEVSSHALALKRVHGIEFDVSLFTNLTQDHLDFHKTMEAYAEAKALLFRRHTKSYGIVNCDDPAAKIMMRGFRKKKLTYGQTPSASFSVRDIESSAKGTRVSIVREGEEFILTSRLVGSFNAYNLTGAFSVAATLGIDAQTIKKGISRVKSIGGRFELIRSKDGVTAIVDYSHTPDSLSKAIYAARELLNGDGKIITVFGCGGDRDQGKRALMGEAATRLSDITIVTTDNPRQEDPERIIDEIMKGVIEEAAIVRKSNRKTAIRHALRIAASGDIVLIAGKGHENYQIIGTRKIHLDDREIVRKFLTEKRGGVKL